MVHIPKLRLSRRLRRLRDEEEGQAIAEFALIAPILITLVCGVLVIGSIIYAHIIVVTSANQGARVGSALSADEAVLAGDIQRRARTTAMSTLSNGLNANGNNSTINVSGISNNQLQVSVTYHYQLPIPFLRLDRSYTVEHTASYHVFGDDR